MWSGSITHSKPLLERCRCPSNPSEHLSCADARRKHSKLLVPCRKSTCTSNCQNQLSSRILSQKKSTMPRPRKQTPSKQLLPLQSKVKKIHRSPKKIQQQGRLLRSQYNYSTIWFAHSTAHQMYSLKDLLATSPKMVTTKRSVSLKYDLQGERFR